MTKETHRLGLRFGALSPSIEEQLDEQGLVFTGGDVSFYEEDAQNICRLRIRSIITDSEARRANQRLIKKIARQVRVGRSGNE